MCLFWGFYFRKVAGRVMPLHGITVFGIAYGITFGVAYRAWANELSWVN